MDLHLQASSSVATRLAKRRCVIRQLSVKAKREDCGQEPRDPTSQSAPARVDRLVGQYALCTFQGRIGRYAVVHREFEARLPLKPTASVYILTVKQRIWRLQSRGPAGCPAG